jgi:outer membrane receptor protein involved in Fe transport
VPPTNVKDAAIFTLQRLRQAMSGVSTPACGWTAHEQSTPPSAAGRPATPRPAYGIDWNATARRQRDLRPTSPLRSAGYWKAARTRPSWPSASRGQRPRPDRLRAVRRRPAPGGTGAYRDSAIPTLKSEKVNSIEGTTRFTSDKGRIEGHLYYAKYDGFIEEAPTGDVEDDLGVIQFTQADAKFYGGELEGSYDVWRAGEGVLAVQGAYDYVHGEVANGPAARIPPYSVTAGLNWTSPRFDLKGEVRYVAEQDRVSIFEIPTDGYTLLNIKATYKPAGAQGLKLFIDGHNLTDEAAREHTSFLKDIAPLPGRSIRAGFAYEF